MFLGHFAVAFAAKRSAPRASLGLLIGAAQLPDLLWPVFLLVGWERAAIDPGNTAFTPLAFLSYPISHSLLTVVGWGVALGILTMLVARDRRSALVAACLVISHWILDAITHRPDLPLVPGSATRVGLGLWHSVAATHTVELTMYAAGVWLYARSTTARTPAGTWSFIALAAILLLIHFANAFGGAPPSIDAVAIVTLALLLFPLWGFWTDHRRDVLVAPEPKRSTSAI